MDYTLSRTTARKLFSLTHAPPASISCPCDSQPQPHVPPCAPTLCHPRLRGVAGPGHSASKDCLSQHDLRLPLGYAPGARAGATPHFWRGQRHTTVDPTGEFVQRTQKRYDDTVLILAELLENGYDSARGTAALKRMNRQHGHHAIPNEAYVYTLSTFMLEPLRWNARFGWRAIKDTECQASYYFWRVVGERMGIRDIPEGLAAFDRFNRAFERAHFAYSDNNRVLAEVTRNFMLAHVLPWGSRALGAPLINAMMDDRWPMQSAFRAPRRCYGAWPKHCCARAQQRCECSRYAARRIASLSGRQRATPMATTSASLAQCARRQI